MFIATAVFSILMRNVIVKINNYIFRGLFVYIICRNIRKINKIYDKAKTNLDLIAKLPSMLGYLKHTEYLVC